ncbi:hypothetical protein GCM10011390_37000 [Aureimonas endophytica]|uniref:Uncharacterized protein n=1 Tax=Aureimonas endophytica TaxID=2027858 RepID=A0A916ZU70_9HYPH|nr:hypothetical protein GCM10011390_37000 [Aureimonas endophytica]
MQVPDRVARILMRMITPRDERILETLSQHAGNDLVLVGKALETVRSRARQGHQSTIEETVEVIRQMRRQQESRRESGERI